MNDSDIRPILTLSNALQHPFRVSEKVSVYNNGAVWYWLTAAANRGLRHRAGTFTFQLENNEFERIQQLGQALGDLPPQNVAPARGHPALTVTAVAGDKEQSHLLPVALPDTPPDLLAQAYDLYHELTQRTEDSPYAAITTSVGAKWPRNKDKANLIFTFKNIGVEPTSFLLKPDTFVAWEQVKAQQKRCWQNKGAPGMGLMNSTGKLIDGIRTFATLQPGQQASLLFKEVLKPTLGGEVMLTGQMEGFINLVYPQGESHRTDFWLTSQPEVFFSNIA
jgi:hypothetical protein